MINPLLLTDGYKLGHKSETPEGTTKTYSNLTPRGSRMDTDYAMFFGMQYVCKELLIKQFNEGFFNRPKQEVMKEIDATITSYLGSGFDASHFAALHDLGYLPLKIKALPEGSKVPLRVPVMTIENTHDDFFWLTNYLETVISSMIWMPCTSLTTAYKYRQTFDKFAKETGDESFVDFQGHDFSFRGMSSTQSAIVSGMAFLTCFKGTDCVPALNALVEYYGADLSDSIGHSVPATEHALACLYTALNDEYSYFEDLITKIHPAGIVSLVSDTYDYWGVLTEFLPRLKDQIMARDGKVVIRPDCYDSQTEILTPDGWKFFSQLTEEDTVAQVLDDGSRQFVKPSKIVNEQYDGDMHHFTDHFGKVDLLVTPNHRMVLEQDGRERIVDAQNLGDGHHKQKMIRSASAPSKPENHISYIDRLKIAFQADGSFQTGTKTNKIRFSFSKQRKIDRLTNILNYLELKYKIYDLSDGRVEFNITLNEGDFVKDLSWVNEKSLTKEWCQEFIEECSYWDSCRRSDDRLKFDTTNLSVANKVEFVALSAGYGVLKSMYKDDRSEDFNIVHTLHILKNNKVGGQSWVKNIVPYSGTVHCVTVPSGKVFVRRNKCTLVSGNSGDPVEIICGTKISTVDYDGDDLVTWMDYVAEDLDDIIRDDTPHGEYGGNVSKTYRFGGESYEVTYSPLWNRYDKQYYYIDNMGEATVQFCDFVKTELSPEQKGSIQILWDLFGGTVNAKGYKELDPHIGLIYGEAITPERQEEIFTRLKAQGFASTNVVLGLGSYGFQYKTRDSLGWAIKGVYAENNGEGYALFKDPKTDDGTKKSAKGLVRVNGTNGNYTLEDGVDWDREGGALEEVFLDGVLTKEVTLKDVRDRVKESL